MGIRKTFRQAYEGERSNTGRITRGSGAVSNDELAQFVLAQPYRTTQSDEDWKALVSGLIKMGLVSEDFPALRAAVDNIVNCGQGQ